MFCIKVLLSFNDFQKCRYYFNRKCKGILFVINYCASNSCVPAAFSQHTPKVMKLLP